MDSGVVPVSRQDEIDTRYLLAEPDATEVGSWARHRLQLRTPSALPCVMEWRLPGLPSLFTLTSALPSGRMLRAAGTETLAAFVTGFRHCDPSQVRIWNGSVYRKTFRRWRPVRDLNHGAVKLDTILALARVLGIEVECSLGWTFSRWLQARLAQTAGTAMARRLRQELSPTSSDTAA